MSITYSLSFTMNPEAVSAINDAGQFVTIVKQVDSANKSAGDVAWLTFQAAQSIQVSWQESYYLYATNQSLEAGAVIKQTAQTVNPALSGYQYVFNAAHLFVNPAPGFEQGAFNVNDQAGRNDWKFGLAQLATVSTNPRIDKPVPLNVVKVLNNELVTFKPRATVSVFLQSYDDNGIVISQVKSNALTVELIATDASASIGFSDADNTFFRAPTP
jgi:hypothetical protein